MFGIRLWSSWKLGLGLALVAFAGFSYVAKLPRVIGAPELPPFQPVPAATGDALTFIAVGDTGRGDRVQRKVGQAMAETAEREGADFVVLLGDNFYGDGVASADDPQWESAFREPYHQDALQIPFYAALGNHDYGLDPLAQVGWDGDPRWNMPERYYSVEHAVGADHTLEIFVLDTVPLMQRPTPEARAQLVWLEEALKASSAHWKFVTGHHQLVSGGRHGDNRHFQWLVADIFDRYGVDLYLHGHDHHLAMMLPAQGSGPPAVISGAGSRVRDVIWTEETAYAAAEVGFTWLRVEPEVVWIAFHTVDDGRTFTYPLIKSGLQTSEAQAAVGLQTASFAKD